MIGQSDPFAEPRRDGRRPEPRQDDAAGGGWPEPAPRRAPEAYDPREPAESRPYSGHDRPFDDPRYAAEEQQDAAFDPDERPAEDSDAPAVPGYAAEEYEEEPPRRGRRGGLVVVIAVLGLAVVGTAGAFGYRAMFGGSLVPSLPPIIKASDRPDKVAPAAPAADSKTPKTSYDRVASLGQDEKVVPREEQPVDMKEPPKAAPRIISTIPVVGGTAPVAPLSAPPPGAAPAPAPAASASAAPTAEPKKIRTVVIRADQPGGVSTSTAMAQPPGGRGTAAHRTGLPSANEPLALMPSGGETAAPAAPAPAARTRTAARTPAPSAPAAVASGSGGYAVQVSSQRSEGEAQSAYKSLQTRFPTQLSSHQPLIRRADLGSKGVYYRALVGPFGSMEEAAGLCSSLKAAGGTCVVQKN